MRSRARDKLNRTRIAVSGVAAFCALLGMTALLPAQTGIFSIFRTPQAENAPEPFADAEEDVEAYVATGAPLTIRPSDEVLRRAPAISAAPNLPLPPRRSTPVENPAAPAPPPPANNEEAATPPAAPEAPPQDDPDAYSSDPRMLAALVQPNHPAMRTPIVPQKTTPEEIEAEERNTPEPAHVEKQTEKVDIACLKPELIAIMRKAADKFGGTPVITSGQRNRGRLGSYHRKCMAADFFIPGVARADLARYLRTLPEAGGVGTYCHTKSVHVDIGEPRNWSQCGFRFRFSLRG